MESFKDRTERIIKKLQMDIIKNTLTLDDDVRAKVYSRFQSIKYKLINAEGLKKYNLNSNTRAFYTPEEDCIVIVDTGMPIKEIELLHEMLHFLSSDARNKEDLDNDLGFMRSRYFYLDKDNGLAGSIIGRGINEGATQFFAENIFNAKISQYYPFEVNLFSVLCKECGIEKLKEAYFTHDIKRLKSVIREGYHLKNDYLIDKLIHDMDAFGVLEGLSGYFNHLPVLMGAYMTALQMKYNKILAENNNKKSRAEIIKNFNIYSYFCENIESEYIHAFQYMLDSLSLEQMGFVDKSDRNEYCGSLSQLSSKFVYAVEKHDLDFLVENYNTIKGRALLILQQLCTENNYLKLNEEKTQLVPIEKAHSIKTLLNILHTKNTKIDLSYLSKDEKYEFIALSLYNSYIPNNELYTHFKPSDLVEFINTGLLECDVFCNPKAMEYIWPKIDNVKQSVKNIEDFYKIYKKVGENQMTLKKE